MKKFFLLIYFIFSLVGLRAQIHYGIKAGYNLSSLLLSGSDIINTQKSKSAFNPGVFSSIPLFNAFYLQPEISYSQQGSQSKDSLAKTNFNYINVPVLFKYKHASGVFLETGPQIGFLLSSNYKSETFSEDLSSVSKSLDFSWAFGAEYEISTINLGLDIRYNYGMTNTTIYSPDLAKNSVLQIDLFYRLK